MVYIFFISHTVVQCLNYYESRRLQTTYLHIPHLYMQCEKNKERENTRTKASLTHEIEHGNEKTDRLQSCS